MEVITGTLTSLGSLYIAKKTFDRSPRRKVPALGIVSPASGKIIAIENINPEKFDFKKKGILNTVVLPDLGTSAKMLIIEMNIKDVHVQRAPIQGKIVYKRHIKGRHKNVIYGRKKVSSYIENEKYITIFKGDDISVAVIQVAGLVARRIKNKYKVGKELNKGDIFGKITFGSQTILLLPQSASLQIKIGDRVIDGETIITN